MALKSKKNSYCLVELTISQDKKIIRSDDLTDTYNEPACFTRNIRGIDKAWEEIENKFNDKTKMGDIYDILRKYSLNPHQYCRVD